MRSKQRISRVVFHGLPSFLKRANRKMRPRLLRSMALSTSAACRRTSGSLSFATKSTGMEEEHLIPHTKHLIVQRGDHVVKGQQLTDGLVIPHEILEICGVRELQKYLVNQVQEVYRLQGVDINDKHIEIIVRQMLKKVRVTDPGDTSLLYGEEVDKKEFEHENLKVIERGWKSRSSSSSIC